MFDSRTEILRSLPRGSDIRPIQSDISFPDFAGSKINVHVPIYSGGKGFHACSIRLKVFTLFIPENDILAIFLEANRINIASESKIESYAGSLFPGLKCFSPPLSDPVETSLFFLFYLYSMEFFDPGICRDSIARTVHILVALLARPSSESSIG